MYTGLAANDVSETLSPLMLFDRLLRLAQDSDRSGYRVAAEHLFHLACQVFDDPQDFPA